VFRTQRHVHPSGLTVIHVLEVGDEGKGGSERFREMEDGPDLRPGRRGTATTAMTTAGSVVVAWLFQPPSMCLALAWVCQGKSLL
jgi:hypothetical protein